MGKPKTPPPPPYIILQTEHYRVICAEQPPFEDNPRPDVIIIERKRKAGLGEEYWGPVHELGTSYARSPTKDEALLLDIFQEVAEAKRKASKAPSALTYIADDKPVAVTVEARPYRPAQEQADRRAKFATMLREMAKMLDNAQMEPRMPFDFKEGLVGIALTPGLMADLANTFTAGSPMNALQLVATLLNGAASELQLASEV